MLFPFRQDDRRRRRNAAMEMLILRVGLNRTNEMADIVVTLCSLSLGIRESMEVPIEYIQYIRGQL